MKRKKSIHDIARELNVSATTVSFVLNGKVEEKRISADLAQKITSYIKEVGYQPNMVAKSLRTGKSNIIGMLVEDISDPFFSAIARFVEEGAYKTGYKILNSSTENKTEKAKELMKVFRDRQVDGYIIAPTPGIEQDVQALMDDSFPVILFDRYFPELVTDTVVIDNYGGAYDAIVHFIENKYENIAFVTLDSDQVQMHERLDGYQKAMAENDLQTSVLKISYNMQVDRIAEKIKTYLKKNPQIDSILFATNYLAIAGLRALKDLGLTVPDNVGVIGFDDNTHFALFTPSITAVAQPVEEISKNVVKLLIARLSDDNKSTKKEKIVLPTQLIVRESSLKRVKKKDTKTTNRK
ncbi:LacI family DNA-binding transcriptional regulator [Chitinophagaceae bacterium LWZ2-11]